MNQLAKREERRGSEGFNPGRPLANLSLPDGLRHWLMIPIQTSDGLPVLKASQAPTTAERQAIERHVANVNAALAMTSSDRMAVAITELEVCFPAGARTEQESKARANGFRKALSDIPAWAIEAACTAWLRGEVDGGASRYAPNPPELRKVCLQKMAPMMRERRMLERVLAAEVEPEYCPEERAAQKQRVERLGRILAGTETYVPKAGRS